MANVKGKPAPEGAIDGVDSEGAAIAANPKFAELADWVKESEELNPNIRIKSITSTDSDLPESLVLRFSHPEIISGAADGYTLSTGVFVAYN